MLPPFKLERYFAPYEHTVKYLLCSSDCESLSIAELLAMEPDAQAQFQQHWLGYTEYEGAPGLRREISRIYTHIQPEQTLVFSGAEEAIYWFMQAVLTAGDHIIVHTPCYQSLAEVARGIGAQVTPWVAHESAAWAVDLDELRNAIRPNTRAIVVNTPHNPTGYLMPAAQFAELHRIADQHGIVVFCDEVYRESEYELADRLPASCDLSPNAVSLGVMSKTYGLAGLRIGWVATRNRAVFERMAQLKDYSTICNAAPSEFLAELALRHRVVITQRNLDIIQKNLVLLDGFFARHSNMMSWQRPKAGTIAFPHLIGHDVASFCHNLVTQSGVLLLPGTLYDDRDNHFRIGFGRKNMREALAVLEQFIEK